MFRSECLTIDQAPYDLEPEDWTATDQRASRFDLYERFLVFKERLASRFRRSKRREETGGGGDTDDSCRPGDEMTQELTDAWNLFTRVNGGPSDPPLSLHGLVH